MAQPHQACPAAHLQYLAEQACKLRLETLAKLADRVEVGLEPGHEIPEGNVVLAGLLQPPRGVNAAAGAVEEEGNCIDQPFEEVAHPEANYKDRIKIKAYRIEPKSGILWAYLGPDPAPLVPDWDYYHVNGYKQVIMSYIPCNWMQCQENSIDPVHFEWLHSNWSTAMKGGGDRAPTHLKLGFDEFEHGFVYRRVREDTTEDDELWTTGRVCFWPNALYTGFFEWRVPIDDDNTFSIADFNNPVPGDEPF